MDDLFNNITQFSNIIIHDLLNFPQLLKKQGCINNFHEYNYIFEYTKNIYSNVDINFNLSTQNQSKISNISTKNIEKTAKDFEIIFVSSEILKEYSSQNLYNLSFTFETKNLEIDVKIEVPEIILKNKEPNYKLLLENIVYHLNFLNNFYQEINKKKLELRFFLSNKNKKINWFTHDKNPILTAKEINSGYYNKNDEKICIFRKEEIIKILYHEFFHFLNLENGIFDTFSIFLKNNIKHKNTNFLHLEEGYVDFWADILYFYNFSPENLQLLLQINTIFLIFQCSKILLYFGFKSFNEIFIINSSENIINESTNFFGYFIIKTMLFLKMTTIFDIIFGKKRIRNIPLLNEKQKKKISDCVSDAFLDNKIQSLFNFCMNAIQKIGETEEIYKIEFLMNSMRRNIFEFK